MSKTPEQMAKEYCEEHCSDSWGWWDYKNHDAFLAGYQAAKPQWISVKERHPHNGDYVLVYCNYIAKISMAVALLDYWEKWGVTHWMPLPKPPEDK